MLAGDLVNDLRENVRAVLIGMLALSGNACSSGTHPASSLDASVVTPEGGGDTGGPEASGGADGGSVPQDCGVVQNDPACPSIYAPSDDCQPCSPVGLTCVYPIVGDGSPASGCIGSASLACTSDDAGFGCPQCWTVNGGWTCPVLDAGDGHWLAFQ